MIPGLPGQVQRLVEASNHRTEGPQSPRLMHVGINKWGTRKVKAQGTRVRDRAGARIQVFSLQGWGTSISFYKCLITQERQAPHLKKKMQVGEKNVFNDHPCAICQHSLPISPALFFTKALVSTWHTTHGTQNANRAGICAIFYS